MKVKDSFGNSFELFVNPSSRDLKELPKDIRFLASTKTKKLYVWNMDSMVHKRVWNELRTRGLENGVKEYDESSYIFPGSATNIGGKLKLDIEDSSYYMDKTRYKHDWSWLDKYIKNFSKMFEEELRVT